MTKRRLRSTRRSGVTRYLIPAVIIFGAVGVLFASAVKGGLRIFQTRMERDGRDITVPQLWESGDYAAVASAAEERIREYPLDSTALMYAGYSRFYMALSRLSVEERSEDLDACIRYLRLLKATGVASGEERIDYVLGKAYLLKGPYWADLAVHYLTSSLDSGYLADDTYEYLGRSHSALGDFETALSWYEKAAETHPTDQLLLTLGKDAFNLGRYNDAAEYYSRAIEQSRDDSLKKRGLSQLGQLYYDVGNYTMARGVLERLVSMEPGNKDYQFLLAETYHELGMNTEARRTWFIVTRIDPGHVGALRRLYN